MTGRRTVAQVTCLGCGCACDDITVQVRDERIEGITPSCPVAREWFGDGAVPAKILVGGTDATLGEALTEAAGLLADAAGRVLAYCGLDLSVQAQREAIALADLLKAVADGSTSEPAAAGLLAAQRRGRAAATLGEIRNRADVLLFWGVDPARRYPRYLSRYALDPVGSHVPQGRAGRTVISIGIGADRGPERADIELSLEPHDEIAALSVLRAAAAGNPIGDLPERLQALAAVADRLTQARYAVIVHDAEPGSEERDPHRAEGLIALAQALNGPTRAALSSLRGGGNRSGTEVALTWQTGYPMAVDFSSGFPRYEPGNRGLGRAAEGEFSTALIVGSAAALPGDSVQALAKLATVLVGPRASESPLSSRVAIDTGVAGIHEAGIAYRMDDVPLPLTPPLSGPPSAADTLRALLDAVRGRLAGRSA